MRHEYILAIDVGAGSLRAGLVRANGRRAAAAAIPLATAEPRAGWAEIDPERWWQALLVAIARVLRAMPRSGRVLGVCICGLTRTQVLLDRQRRAVGPAILFRDRRAVDVARELGREMPADDPADAITAFDRSARLAWIARHQPARFRRIDAVVEPKDFLNFRLTGTLAGDSVTYSRRRASSRNIAEYARLQERDLVAPWQQLGVVQPVAPPLARIAGVPVFAGSLDTWASAVGSGAVRPGQAYDVAGTSEVVGLLTANPIRVPGLVSLAWTEHAHQIGGPTQAGADCARWCHSTFRIGGRLEHAVEDVGRGLPHSQRPLFLPYLEGERAPVWRSDVRGAFHGVGRSSAPNDFLWAVLEGVAMAVRDILEQAQAGSGARAAELRVAGGGARSDAWCRMKADVIGVPVLRATEAETGVVGAAIAAAVGLGIHGNVSDAAAAMVAPGQRFEPRRRHAAIYAARAARYQQVKQAALALAALSDRSQ
jgi:xylulokinase